MNRRGFLRFLGLGVAAMATVTPGQLIAAVSRPLTVPSGCDFGAELIAVTRRAFIPKLVTQMYQQSTLLSALLPHSTVDGQSGGILQHRAVLA